jgi:hypothetical protein
MIAQQKGLPMNRSLNTSTVRGQRSLWVCETSRKVMPQFAELVYRFNNSRVYSL